MSNVGNGYLSTFHTPIREQQSGGRGTVAASQFTTLIPALGDPFVRLAAAEAVLGLLIEVSFIATFTQRFFGR